MAFPDPSKTGIPSSMHGFRRMPQKGTGEPAMKVAHTGARQIEPQNQEKLKIRLPLIRFEDFTCP